MMQAVPITLGKFEYFSEPYPHCHSLEVLDPDTAQDILQWMETDALWGLVETDFYEQFEFNLHKVEIPTHLRFLVNGSFASTVHKYMSSTFDVTLSEKINIVAHKLVPGQSIRIHNDYLEGAETHRLIIQFNSSWTNSNGGLFVIFASANPENVHRIIHPVHNSAVGFAISGNSHHAVSTVYNNTRYSLILSLRPPQ